MAMEDAVCLGLCADEHNGAFDKAVEVECSHRAHLEPAVIQHAHARDVFAVQVEEFADRAGHVGTAGDSGSFAVDNQAQLDLSTGPVRVGESLLGVTQGSHAPMTDPGTTHTDVFVGY